MALPWKLGNEIPEPPQIKVRNPLRQGVLGKRAIGGLRWGDILAGIVALAEPRGAMELYSGFQQGVQNKQAQADDQYNRMLPVWQRQQAEVADRERYAEDRVFDEKKFEEDKRWHDLQNTNRGTTADIQTRNARIRALLPIISRTNQFTPAMESYVETGENFPDMSALAPLPGSTAQNNVFRQGIDTSKAFGINALPTGLPFSGPTSGPITGGSIGLTNAGVPLRQAQTANTTARTADTVAMTPVKVRRGNAQAAVSEQTPGRWDADRAAREEAAIRRETVLAQRDAARSAAQLASIRLRAQLNPPAQGSTPKAPKPLSIEKQDALHARKSLMPLSLYKKWEASGGAYGPQAKESLLFWSSPAGENVIDATTGEILETATPEAVKRFLKDQEYWLNGRWKYGGPGKRIDTWAKPQSQVQTVPAAPRRRGQMPQGMTVDAKGNIVKAGK